MNILRHQRKFVLLKKQKEVAKVAGVDVAAISAIELGKKRIPYYRLREFEKAYGLTIQQMAHLVDKRRRYATR